MNKPLEHINQLLDHESISQDAKEQVVSVLEKCLKDKELDAFLIDRLRKNDKITKRFLNVTINELEEKNLELNKYIESNMQLENFAHIASHDLKAPLINIIAFAQLLGDNLSHLKGTPEFEFIKNIELSAIHMQETIQGLFRFSRATNAKLKLKKFDVKKLLDELLIDLDEIIKQHQASITLEEMPKVIKGDRVLIKEVFHNLILNAIKFKEKQKDCTVSIKGTSNDNEWKFAIKDNGIGIDDEFNEKIFLIFKRLHSAQEYPGTGIGLALCKSIIENHGGKIWVESQPKKGSTFYFTIRR